MSNEQLFPIGEQALRDIADDIIVLDEIRNRFRAGLPILGYQNWREFVAKNSKYSLRTVQRRLNEVNGVRPYTKPALQPVEIKNADVVQVEHVTSSDEMAYRTAPSAPNSQRQCESALDEGQQRLAEWGTIYPLKTPYTYDEHREWYKTFLKDYLKDGPMLKIAPVGNSAEAGAFTDARVPIVSGGLGIRTINGLWHLPHQVPAGEFTATLNAPQDSEPMCFEDEVVTLALRVIDAGFEALKDSVDPNHLHAAVQRAKQSLRTDKFSN